MIKNPLNKLDDVLLDEHEAALTANEKERPVSWVVVAAVFFIFALVGGIYASNN